MNSPVVRELVSGVQLFQAINQRDRVIDPFQYYALAGESITCERRADQTGLSNFFVHKNRAGKLLARFFEADSDAEPNGYGLGEGETQAADFAELMREMHLAASRRSATLFAQKDLEKLQEGFAADPIVIGGCGRSGTTLLLSMLGSHSSVFAVQDEIYAFYPFPFRLPALSAALKGATGGNWKRWCEKTPKNVRAFERIWDAFAGKVRLIHIVRDGRDVVCSHHPNHAQEYWVTPERWIADVGAGLDLPFGVHVLKYEDLLQNPEATLRALCDFIAEPYEETMLRPEKNSSITTNVAWEGAKIRALDTRSIGRWQEPVHRERADEFMKDARAMQLMERLGYV